jgi:hypothetical protein
MSCSDWSSQDDWSRNIRSNSNHEETKSAKGDKDSNHEEAKSTKGDKDINNEETKSAKRGLKDVPIEN